ncbi:MAG: 30S ribosomal protein S16 [Candidatus Colwellbacteria bacterium RBG_13_48_8]|uniref:Small ribosomal subunit protein bS16 n=1 Tax=Candidatus Colwellbacteria bacterium RBG_13_48_8 TaxID=1797685 RepID=A0A1G1YXQ6_9BACT|nr:MAG: 30S ribosomal protein S16 [Candidatus Colwellbacteria bacterium RBG_13_48_8]
MLAIKLRLVGKKGQHSFRIIVQEKRSKLQGKFVDDLGWFNPHTNQFKINQEKVKYWLSQGVEPTGSIQSLLAKSAGHSDAQGYAGRSRPKKKKKDKLTPVPGGGAVPAEIGSNDIPEAVQQAVEENSLEAEVKSEPGQGDKEKADGGSPS